MSTVDATSTHKDREREKELQQLRRRLSKALNTASSLKSKALMEVEVNKELARRNEEARQRQRAAERQLEEIKDLLTAMHSSLSQLRERVSLEPALTQTKEIQREFDQLDSTLREATQLTVAGTVEDSLKPKASSDPQRPRSKPRRHSTLLNLPEASGTSLLRKSVNMSMYISADSINSLQFHEVHGDVDSVHSSRSTVVRTPLKTPNAPLSVEDSLSHSISLTHKEGEKKRDSNTSQEDKEMRKSVQSISLSHNTEKAKDGERAAHTDTHSQREAHTGTESEAESLPPLFEHFLVIGAHADMANAFAAQLKASAGAAEEDTLSHRLKRTFGGILGVGASKVMGATMSANNNNNTVATATNANVNSMSAVGVSLNNTEQSGNNSNTYSSSSSLSPSANNVSFYSQSNNATINNNNNNNVSAASTATATSSFFGFGRSLSASVPLTATESERDRERASFTEDPLAAAASAALSPSATVNKSSFMSFFSRSTPANNTVNTAVNSNTNAIVSPQRVSFAESESSDYHSHSHTLSHSPSQSESQSGKLRVHSVSTLSKVLKAPQNEFELFVASVPEDEEGEDDEETIRLAAKYTQDTQNNDSKEKESRSKKERSLSVENVHVSQESLFPSPVFDKNNDSQSARVPENDVPLSPERVRTAPLYENDACAPSGGEILSCDKRRGTAAVSASLLYRYPPSAAPPPSEVCDFCLPLGAKLSHITPRDEESVVQEILFGHAYSKRSGRCFIFVLDDKTVSTNAYSEQETSSSEETGSGMGRLYGVCVLVPRLLTSSVSEASKKARPQRSMSFSANVNTNNNNSNSAAHHMMSGVSYHDICSDTSMHTSNSDNSMASHSTSSVADTTVGNTASTGVYEFESTVCYAFLTRFPLFDLFFSLIFDILALERVHRMNLNLALASATQHRVAQINSHSHTDIMDDARFLYEYLPQEIYRQAMQTLSSLSVPRFRQRIQYRLSDELPLQSFLRVAPPRESCEYDVSISDWALPTLLSWIEMDTLVWTLSLLLTETQLLVVGHEAGLVSCTVLGLLSLLRPLEWMSPVIPVLPGKLLDFIESPVPIVAGILLDTTNKSVTALSLLQRCSDASCNGHPVAVFDVDRGEVLLSGVPCVSTLSSLCIPDAGSFYERLKESGSAYFADATFPTAAVTVNGPKKPSYITSTSQREEAKRLHGVVFMHINAVVSLGTQFHKHGGIKAVDEEFLEADLYHNENDLNGDEEDDEEDEEEDTHTGATPTANTRGATSRASKGQELLDFYTKLARADGPAVLLEAKEKDAEEARRNMAIINVAKQDSSASLASTAASSIYSASASSLHSGNSSNAFAASKASVIKVNKSMFAEGNHSKFMKRFTTTQMFREYLDANAMI